MSNLKALWYIITHADVIIHDINDLNATLDCAGYDELPIGKIWREICWPEDEEEDGATIAVLRRVNKRSKK